MSNHLKLATCNSTEILIQEGWSQWKVSRELGINRETVARYVRQVGSKPDVSIAEHRDMVYARCSRQTTSMAARHYVGQEMSRLRVVVDDAFATIEAITQDSSN